MHSILIPFSGIAIVIIILCVIWLIIRHKRKSTDPQYYPESEQLYIGNLSYQINAFQLREIFEKFGELQNVRLIKNSHTGRSKGFAFVTYSNMKDAKKALSLNGEDIRGRPIVVRMAKPREETT